MATTNTRSRRGSITGRQSSVNETTENKQMKQQTSTKVLVLNGKCSQIFKSTLMECVEDCVLEFPGETSIYIPKSGQKSGSNKQNISYCTKDSNPNQSSRLTNRRRSSVTQFNLPQITGTRSSQINNLTLPTVALTATSASRLRQKFALTEHITEETTDYQSSIQDLTINEFENENTQIFDEETITYPSNFDAVSQSFSPFHRKMRSAPVQNSYRNRQKDFRLSDLVMRGPEYYAHIFNLPRTSRYPTRATSRQRINTSKQQNPIESKYSELDLVKQDLFHRYLWTQKPQVSCRIRPMSTYSRNATFVL